VRFTSSRAKNFQDRLFTTSSSSLDWFAGLESKSRAALPDGDRAYFGRIRSVRALTTRLRRHVLVSRDRRFNTFVGF